jgi:hypothetical protein
MKFMTLNPATDSENVAPSASTGATPKTMDKTMSFESLEKDQKRSALTSSPLQNQIMRDQILAQKEMDEDRARRKRKERKLKEERDRQEEAEEEKRQAKRAKKQKLEKAASKKSKGKDNNLSNDDSSFSSNSQGQHQQHEFNIQYPSTSLPDPSIVKASYDERRAANPSLKKGSVQIEDLLQAICGNENKNLKVLQARCQKEKDLEGKVACERARSAIKEIQIAGEQALKDSREAEVMRKDESKRSHPLNVENWAKVSTLMESLATLKAEERSWAVELREVEAREKALASGEFEAKIEKEVRTMMDLERSASLDDSTASAQEDMELVAKVNETVNDVVADMTLQADRINQTLRSVAAVVEEGERVKRDLYHGYTSNSMFADYAGKSDPKGLIRGMLK